MNLQCEGWSAEDPIHEDDLRYVFKDLNHGSRERSMHDRDGWFAEEAGSAECIALGHTASDYDDEFHPYGWGGYAMCIATKYGEACSECEAEGCSALVESVSSDRFWALFA